MSRAEGERRSRRSAPPEDLACRLKLSRLTNIDASLDPDAVVSYR